MIAVGEVHIGMPWLTKHRVCADRPPGFGMAGEVIEAKIRFGLSDQADQFYAIQNPNQARTEQFAGDCEGGTIVEIAGEDKIFNHGKCRSDF